MTGDQKYPDGTNHFHPPLSIQTSGSLRTENKSGLAVKPRDVIAASIATTGMAIVSLSSPIVKDPRWLGWVLSGGSSFLSNFALLITFNLSETGEKWKTIYVKIRDEKHSNIKWPKFAFCVFGGFSVLFGAVAQGVLTAEASDKVWGNGAFWPCFVVGALGYLLTRLPAIPGILLRFPRSAWERQWAARHSRMYWVSNAITVMFVLMSGAVWIEMYSPKLIKGYNYIKRDLFGGGNYCSSDDCHEGISLWAQIFASAVSIATPISFYLTAERCLDRMYDLAAHFDTWRQRKNWSPCAKYLVYVFMTLAAGNSLVSIWGLAHSGEYLNENPYTSDPLFVFFTWLNLASVMRQASKWLGLQIDAQPPSIEHSASSPYLSGQNQFLDSSDGGLVFHSNIEPEPQPTTYWTSFGNLMSTIWNRGFKNCCRRRESPLEESLLSPSAL